MLYVLCTGRAPALFPEVATTLVNPDKPPEFFPLNAVIMKACQPFPTERYASASQMSSDLEKVQKIIEKLAVRVSS